MLKGNRRNPTRTDGAKSPETALKYDPTKTMNIGHEGKNEKIKLIFNHSWNYFFRRILKRNRITFNQIKVTNRRKQSQKNITIKLFFSFCQTRNNINSPYNNTLGHSQIISFLSIFLMDFVSITLPLVLITLPFWQPRRV